MNAEDFTPEELAEASILAGVRLRSVPAGTKAPLPADDWHNLLRYTVAKGKAPDPATAACELHNQTMTITRFAEG